MSIDIHLDRVWKSYPSWTAGSRTLRGVVSRRMPLLVRGGERRWALRDVSLEVQRGDSVGVIGPNGAGKSTLLRLVSGLGRPTRGDLAVSGDTAAVLSLGDAFDLSLSGSENAMTTAVIAGFRRAEARRLVPAMLEFAELEPFADAPVRTYSEGMKLRLAFGVVAQLRPQVLLLDEVIAVGDLRFQAKCMEWIHEMRSQGATLLFASHSLEQVRAECRQVVWLQGGAVRAFGEAETVIAAYQDESRSQTVARTPAPQVGAPAALELRRNRFGSQELVIENVVLSGADGAQAAEVASGSPLTVTLDLVRTEAPVHDPIVGVAIHRLSDGVVCWDTSTEAAGVRLAAFENRRRVELVVERLDLLPGEYALDVGVYPPSWEFAYDYHWQAYPFQVTGPGGEKGVFRPPHRWVIDR